MKKSIFDVPYEVPEIHIFEFCPGSSIAEASYDSGNAPEGVEVDPYEFTW